MIKTIVSNLGCPTESPVKCYKKSHLLRLHLRDSDSAGYEWRSDICMCMKLQGWYLSTPKAEKHGMRFWLMTGQRPQVYITRHRGEGWKAGGCMGMFCNQCHMGSSQHSLWWRADIALDKGYANLFQFPEMCHTPGHIFFPFFIQMWGNFFLISDI